jgi:hypothetical protein
MFPYFPNPPSTILQCAKYNNACYAITPKYITLHPFLSHFPPKMHQFQPVHPQ